jgi:hypothetical protein
LGSKYINNEENLPTGFFIIYRTTDLKGGILNVSENFLTQIVHNNLLLIIPIDESIN